MAGYHRDVFPVVTPQLVANNGITALRAAIADPTSRTAGSRGIVLKYRRSPYRDGTRAGWWKVKDPRWYEREACRFDRR